MGAPTERLVPIPDCDHREICKPGGKNSHYKKLLIAINDGLGGSQPDAESSQGTIIQTQHKEMSYHDIIELRYDR